MDVSSASTPPRTTEGADLVDRRPVLLVRVGGRGCALPLDCVVETTRPLPLQALPGLPPPIIGVSVIRGAPVPVIDLRLLLGEPPAPPTRYVTAQAGGRTVAWAVDRVAGVEALDRSLLEASPPLVRGAAGGVVEALTARDATLLTLLDTARVLGEEEWRRVAEVTAG